MKRFDDFDRHELGSDFSMPLPQISTQSDLDALLGGGKPVFLLVGEFLTTGLIRRQDADKHIDVVYLVDSSQ